LSGFEPNGTKGFGFTGQGKGKTPLNGKGFYIFTY